MIVEDSKVGMMDYIIVVVTREDPIHVKELKAKVWVGRVIGIVKILVFVNVVVVVDNNEKGKEAIAMAIV